MNIIAFHIIRILCIICIIYRAIEAVTGTNLVSKAITHMEEQDLPLLKLLLGTCILTVSIEILLLASIIIIASTQMPSTIPTIILIYTIIYTIYHFIPTNTIMVNNTTQRLIAVGATLLYTSTICFLLI